jgi:hypothetical protein
MPDWPRRASAKSSICCFQLRFISTASVRFGRSKPVTTMSAPPPNSLEAMSSRVIGSAVAVSAAMGVSGNLSFSLARSAYSGRNAGPHCEMQCASSTAISDGRSLAAAASIRSVISRSGDM